MTARSSIVATTQLCAARAMSHFSLLVIGDDVEGQLAPYNENLPVDDCRYNPRATWVDDRPHAVRESGDVGGAPQYGRKMPQV